MFITKCRKNVIKKEIDITYDTLCEKTRNKKTQYLQYGGVVSKDCFVVFTAAQFPYVILCPNSMIVKTEQVPHRRIRRRIVFKYEMLLLLKLPQNSSIDYCNH